MVAGKRKKRGQIKSTKKKVGGGSKLNRTEVIGVRLDPKLKFAAELGARKQRRTLSSYIEWAIEEATKSTTMLAPNNSTTADVIMRDTWNSNDCLRLVNLALNYPQFLTFEEEKIWNLILQYSKAWVEETLNLTLIQSKEKFLEEFWKITTEDFERLKALWPHFLAAGKGDEDEESFVIRECYKHNK